MPRKLKQSTTYNPVHPVRAVSLRRTIAALALQMSLPFLVIGLVSSVTVWTASSVWAAGATPYHTQYEELPPGTPCAELARFDPTTTNGTLWGATILSGFGAPGGWFGVPICANGVNQVAPGNANISCDATPTHLAVTGCAPGKATSDGYGLSFQCVELVARFAAWAFGDTPSGWRGDAPYLWLSGHHPADFSPYPNGGTPNAPQPGDILVWGSLDSVGRPWPAGPAGGHVAVVAAVGGGRITFVEENMLGHRGGVAYNIPSETTTLIQNAAGGWTIGPTYGLNGGRALYGWLHSAHDTGHFPAGAASGGSSAASTGAATTSSPSASLTTPSATLADTLPSLTPGVTVTEAGALAELVWSDTHTPERPVGSSLRAPSTPSALPSQSALQAQPQVVIEPLGTPPGVTLSPNQRPAVVVLPDGERYIFVRGQDGALYSAYTAPPPVAEASVTTQMSVAWQALGTPPGVTLMGEVTALWSSRDGVEVGALGSDGAYWLCSGPAGMLGVWLSLGHPAQTVGFQGNPILTLAATGGAQPNSGDPGRRALAIGMDGRLYEADWSAQAAANGSSSGGAGAVGGAPTPAATVSLPAEPSSDMPPGWSAWTPVTLSGVTSALSPNLIAAAIASRPAQGPQTRGAATAAGRASQGGATGEMALLATDAQGQVWLLRSEDAGQSWQTTSLRLPTSTSVVVAAAALGAATFEVYAADTVDTSASSAPLQVAAPSVTPAGDTPERNTTPTPIVSAHAGSATISQATRLAPMLAPPQAHVSLGTFTLNVSANAASGAPSVGNWTALGTGGVTPPSSATSDAFPPQPASPTQATPIANSDPATVVMGVPIAWESGRANQQDSALLVAQGAGVTLLGAPATLHLLAPGYLSGAAAASADSLSLGDVANPAVFSDAFTGDTLDPRWLVTTSSGSSPSASNTPNHTSGANAVAQVALGALTLSLPPTAPHNAQRIAQTVTIAQGAPAGDFTETARVDAATGAGATLDAGMQSGIALRLDAWNQVTLALRAPTAGTHGSSPTIALCAEAAGSAAGSALWCSAPTSVPASTTATSAAPPPPTSTTTQPPSQNPPQTHAQSPQGVYLRVTVSGATIIGSLSLDGVQWTTVGAWTLTWLPMSAKALGPYAPPLAMSTAANSPSLTASATGAATWQRFTSVGLFVSATAPAETTASTSSSAVGAQFSGFSVVPITATGAAR